MSALPSPHGIGTMGRSAYNFIDFLNAAGQKYWQVLPMGPTSYGDSPYQSFSSFAGNPYFIDLDMLVDDGLLTADDVNAADFGDDASRVDYGKIFASRFKLLRIAFERGNASLSDKIAAFRCENSAWLENYALYMAVKGHFDMRAWQAWPDKAIRLREASAVRQYGEKLKDDVDLYVFIQYLFYSQWDELRAYAKENGISFIGDVPIYVAMDSADVWSEPQFFLLDRDGFATEVSGVPPDAFSDEGQLWGNPLYNWRAMESDGFVWWIRRIDGARKLFDVIRIDHFRGFDSYWAVPAAETSAVNGEWRRGPGLKLVSILTSWFHDIKFIAEDLGIITPSVEKLLKDSKLPGMKVLEFGFDAGLDSAYLPHNCVENSVCYIGTHDNNTVLGWVEDQSGENLSFAEEYMHITEDEGWCWGLIRTGMATSCALFVVQVQDILEKSGEARMNFPGTSEHNWQWRLLPGEITEAHAEKLLRYTKLYRRV